MLICLIINFNVLLTTVLVGLWPQTSRVRLETGNPYPSFNRLSSKWVYAKQLGRGIPAHFILTRVQEGFLWNFRLKWATELHLYWRWMILFKAKSATISWRKKSYLVQWDESCLVLFYNTSTLKEQSAARHVNPLRYIMPTPSRSVFVLIS